MEIEVLTDPEDLIGVNENSVKAPGGPDETTRIFGHCGPNGTSMTLRPLVGRNRLIYTIRKDKEIMYYLLLGLKPRINCHLIMRIMDAIVTY